MSRWFLWCRMGGVLFFKFFVSWSITLLANFRLMGQGSIDDHLDIF